MNIVEPLIRQALATPARPAIALPAGDLSYGALLQSVAQLAARLQQAGISRGHRVGIAGEDVTSSIALPLAAAYLGAASLPLPMQGGDATAAAIAAACRATHIILPARREFPGVPPERVLSSTELSAAARQPVMPPQLVPCEPDEIWRIGLSSGTTGMPKGVERSHRSSLMQALMSGSVYPAADAPRLVLGVGWNIFYGTHRWLQMLVTGGCLVVPQSNSAENLLQTIHERGATHVYTSTHVAMQMVRFAQQPGHAWGRPAQGLKMLSVSGSSVPPSLRAALRSHVCESLYIMYGSSETGGVALATPELLDSDPETAGTILPWVEAQAVDEAGTVLPHGTPGRLRFRSDNLASGYSSAVQPGVFAAGWVTTNDWGRVEANGRLYLEGRSDDVINVGGIKHQPAALEARVERDAAVGEAGVTVVTRSLGVPELVALLVPAPGASRDGLAERCAQALRIPAANVGLVDALPRNENGKLDRKRLAAAAAALWATEPA
jgi:acyl-coenzyme A synthetase/AMP-(fatty) acid ligase